MSDNKIIEQLEAGAITDLSLTEAAEDICDDFSKFLTALENNKTIESVDFEGHFLGELRNDSRSDVLAAVGTLPRLRKVRLCDSLLTVNGIKTMICKASDLKELVLENLLLQGISEDFDSFELALYQHPSLKVFKLEKSRPAIRDISLENLTKSAAKLQTPIGSPSPNQKTATTA